jgi:hypothetical protein
MHYLNANAVEDFLESEPQPPVGFSSDPCLLVEWIMAEKWHEMNLLHDRVWKALHVG